MIFKIRKTKFTIWPDGSDASKVKSYLFLEVVLMGFNRGSINLKVGDVDSVVRVIRKGR